ncbi:MAG TPA: CBS domain-containing protein [Polyangiales bacterium]
MLQKSRVADVMTRDVITVFEESNLQEVFGILAPYRFRHLPVVDGKRLVGILSQRDLLQLTSQSLDKNLAARARGVRALEETFVRDVMNGSVVTIRPDASLAEAARLMTTKRVGALPVVNEAEELLGIVSETDLLRSLAHML